jgi:tape measure domain-containing protein
MSFDFAITADPSAALAAERQVVSGLEAIARDAAEASQAMTRAFASGGAAARDAQGKFVATGAKVRETGSVAEAAARQAAAAFGQLNVILDRERVMLERIHGPSMRFQQDVRTLNTLFAQGKVNAAEYAREIGRIHDNARGAGVAAAFANGRPGAGGGGGGAAAAGAAGGGLGRVMAAGAGVFAAAATAKQVLDLSDSYTNLENRLRTVSGGQNSLNELMTKTRAIADGTRSDWTATAEAFVRFNNALKPLGKSQGDVLKFTETLNKALTTSGASSTEAAAGLLQLTQGLASGKLQGDEFRSITEQLPFLLDLFAKQLGVSRGELKKMASEGKITSEVVYSAIMNSKDAIDKTFAQSVPTASQTWQVFKNELVQTVGEFVRTSNILAHLKDAFAALGGAIKLISGIFSAISTVTSAVSSAFDELGNAARLAAGPIGMIGKPFGLIADAMDEIINGTPFWVEAMEKMKREWLTGTPEGQKFNATLVAQLEITRMLTLSMVDLRAATHKAMDPWADSRNIFGKARDQIRDMGKSALDFMEKKKKERDAFARSQKTYGHEVAGMSSGQALENQVHSQTDFSSVTAAAAQFDAAWSQAFDEALMRADLFRNSLATDEQMAEMQAAFERINEPQWKYIRGLEIANQLLADGSITAAQHAAEVARLEREWSETNMTDEMRISMEAVSNAIQLAEDALIDFIVTGKGGFEELFQALDKLILKLILAQAIKAGFGGAAGGPTDPASVITNSLFGYATGGSFYVPGVGGHDSTTVAFRATPGEKVTVGSPASNTRANDLGGNTPSGGQAPNVTIINQHDRRELLNQLDTPEGHTTIFNVIQKIPGLGKK